MRTIKLLKKNLENKMLSPDMLKHKNILIKILKDIFTDPTIGPILGFKGGTAAVLFYGLNRFSVDLDFDLLEIDKKDAVFERIKNILESYGTIKKAHKKRYSLFFLLSYNHTSENIHNIKVEINLRSFGSLFEIRSYLGISMKVMVRSDMVAHKLVAMYERIGKANRDIFDVWFFLNSGWPINKNIIEKRTGMTYQQFLKNCIDTLEKMSDRHILSGIGELLDEKQKIWVKSTLRMETIFLLRLALQNASF